MKVLVKDTIEIRANMPGSSHAPGLIVVFDFSERREEIPTIGCIVELRTPTGHSFSLAIEEMKTHGSGRSFFFAGLHRVDVPIGSSIIWEDDSRLWRRASAVEAEKH